MDPVQLPGRFFDALRSRYSLRTISIYRNHWNRASAWQGIPDCHLSGRETVRITPGKIFVRQGNFTLSIEPEAFSGHPLQAPVGGAMHRTIYEHPSCKVYYRFEINRKTLLELDAPNAAFEYEY